MSLDQIPCEDMILLRKNKERPYVYDVELEGTDCLRDYSSLECHLVLYPYTRQVSSDEVTFFPFEEYVKDITSHQRSAYTEINNSFSNRFGMLLGILIILIVLRFRPDNLFTVEALVSVLGAYLIGKELWADMEKGLVDLTKRGKLKFQESYYRYQLEKHTTLVRYTQLAKQHRYGMIPQLPGKMDFIRRSNSQTLRMHFDMKDFRFLKDQETHILSMVVKPELLESFEKHGFLFGVKLSFNKRSFGLVRSLELFQSIHKTGKGCLSEAGDWAEGKVFYRKCASFWRLKLYLRSGMVAGKSIVHHETESNEEQAGTCESQ